MSWWAAHHRHHHAFSDTEQNVHSPVQRGLLWSHTGWFLSRRHFQPDLSRVRDLLKFPELKLLDRFDILVPVAVAVGLFGLGALLEHYAPGISVRPQRAARSIETSETRRDCRGRRR